MRKVGCQVMVKSRKSTRTIQSPPWITSEGTFDPAKFPIDSVLNQALSSDEEQCRTGCVLLGSMASRGRTEAGVFLVGLMQYFAADLNRLMLIVEQMAHFHHEASANALFGELRRVKSSNVTRRYLDQVLQALGRLPMELVLEGLLDIAEDKSFSPKMRAKFRHAIERIGY